MTASTNPFYQVGIIVESLTTAMAELGDAPAGADSAKLRVTRP